MLERISVVSTFGIKNGNGRRQFIVGHVMVAYDEVDAETLGIGYFVNGLDAAVEDYDELYTRLLGIVDALLAHTVALVVTVGDVILDVGVELLYKLIHQRYSRASVYVVIAIHQDALLAPHSVVKAVDGQVHILHEERIDKVGQLRMEESLGR